MLVHGSFDDGLASRGKEDVKRDLVSSSGIEKLNAFLVYRRSVRRF